MSRLQEIKGKVLVRHVFIQPYQMSDDGREDFEEDVQWLISEIERLQGYEHGYEEAVHKLHLVEDEALDYKQKSEHISKAITAEIATRNHQDMNTLETGIQKGLVIASKIVYEALETEGKE